MEVNYYSGVDISYVDKNYYDTNKSMFSDCNMILNRYGELIDLITFKDVNVSNIDLNEYNNLKIILQGNETRGVNFSDNFTLQQISIIKSIRKQFIDTGTLYTENFNIGCNIDI